MRLWLKFCLIWAVFSLVWGPLTGPDTVKDRILHALVPLILLVVTRPIIRNLQFRRIYRDSGRTGVYAHIGLWVFVIAVFGGPSLAYSLGNLWLRDQLIWVLAFFLYVVPTVRMLILAFKGLRWLARRLVPSAFDPAPADNFPTER